MVENDLVNDHDTECNAYHIHNAITKGTNDSAAEVKLDKVKEEEFVFGAEGSAHDVYWLPNPDRYHE